MCPSAKKLFLLLPLFLSACAGTQTYNVVFVKDRIPRATFRVNPQFKFSGAPELAADMVVGEVILQMEAKRYQRVDGYGANADLLVSIYYGNLEDLPFVPEHKFANPHKNPMLALQIDDIRRGTTLLQAYSFAGSWSRWPLNESYPRLVKKLLAKVPKAGNPFKPVLKHPSDRSFRWAPYEHY